ncbi:MAG: hypothetical protein M1833_001073 [Piccolia ochrophora]|nr:MAG: hypothetical protein M1833_001073 [Piccolia ochrophora]
MPSPTPSSDVRSLLRNTLSARRITHPSATYTPSGNLLCATCRTPIKSESLWDAHIQSTQHVQRLRAASSSTATNSRKRKADDAEGDGADGERKRARDIEGLPAGFFDGEAAVQVPQAEEEGQKGTAQVEEPDVPTDDAASGPAAGLPANFFDAQPSAQPTTTKSNANLPPDPTTTAPTSTAPTSDAEYAAFEAEIASLDPADGSESRPSALTAPADISAPARAAQADADAAEPATRRDQREAELEEEKEDAARRLEREFEEMEGLEERVRRLKERREGLRIRGAEGGAGLAGDVGELGDGETVRSKEGEGDSTDAEEWDEWGFRGT